VNISPSGLHVFAFPVYALDIPDNMLRFIRSLPPAGGKKAAVIAVNGKLLDHGFIPGDGGDPGFSYEHARRALTARGYDVFFTGSVGYPHSITQALSPPSPREQARIRASSDRIVEGFARQIAAGERHIQGWLFPAAYSILPGIAFRAFGRRGLGKLYVADSGCTRCGQCVKACPAGAIRLSLGRPRWNWKCQGCQRCINACPGRAIQCSIPRLALSGGGLFLPLGAWLHALTGVGLFAAHAGVPGLALDTLVWAALYLIILFVADKLLFVLEALPIIGKALSLNLSSGNRRYLDPGFRAVLKEGSGMEQVPEIAVDSRGKVA
jgi:ferredoxin